MKIKFINVNDIVENKLNNVFSITKLDELELSIRQYGLKEPLSVCTQSDGKYRLIAGHRRLSCIKNIYASGKSIMFSDKNLTNVVPCIEERTFENEDEEFLHLASSNKYRRLTPEENKALISKCFEIYKRKLVDDPESVKGVKREVIAKMACVSARTVDKYLKDDNDEEVIKVESSNVVISTINKYKDYVLRLDIDEYGRTDKNQIKDALNELSIICKKKK